MRSLLSIVLLSMLTGCAAHRHSSAKAPTFNFNCDVLALDASTGKPTEMKCNKDGNGLWRKQ